MIPSLIQFIVGGVCVCVLFIYLLNKYLFY